MLDRAKSIKSGGPFRLAFVTGASSGIGKALCRLLAREGIHLVITGRNKHNLYQLADEIRTHVNVVVYPADLSKREEGGGSFVKSMSYPPTLSSITPDSAFMEM